MAKTVRLKLQAPFSAVTLCYDIYRDQVLLRYSGPADQLLASGAIEPTMIEPAPAGKRGHGLRDSHGGKYWRRKMAGGWRIQRSVRSFDRAARLPGMSMEVITAALEEFAPPKPNYLLPVAERLADTRQQLHARFRSDAHIHAFLQGTWTGAQEEAARHGFEIDAEDAEAWNALCKEFLAKSEALGTKLRLKDRGSERSGREKVVRWKATDNIIQPDWARSGRSAAFSTVGECHLVESARAPVAGAFLAAAHKGGFSDSRSRRLHHMQVVV